MFLIQKRITASDKVGVSKWKHSRNGKVKRRSITSTLKKLIIIRRGNNVTFQQKQVHYF